ncbi:MAG: hypothetical protein AABX16_00245 [Nanoarchaeota archaeon]
MTSREIYSDNEKTFYRTHGGFRGFNGIYGKQSKNNYNIQDYLGQTLSIAVSRGNCSLKKRSGLETRLRRNK